MFLPTYRYTPAITETLAEIERLCARLAAGGPDLESQAPARRAAQARRAAGAARLDGIAVDSAEAARILAGEVGDRAAPAARAAHAVTAYAFTLEQIAGDWPPNREITSLPIIAGLNFFLTQDPARRGPPPGLRREPTALCDMRNGRPLALTPPAAAIRPALQELVGWLHSARHAVAPAIRAGIACARLWQIQPQQEANARTACAYTALLLHRADLLPGGLPGIEAAFAADPDRFYAALLTALPPAPDAPAEWTPWLEYFLGVLRDELRALLGGTRPRPTAGPAPVRLNPRQRRILELLTPPGASLANQECQQMFAVSPVTAARDFRELVELGLVEMHGQGRATYYVRVPPPA
jgi:Fic family protein